MSATAETKRKAQTIKELEEAIREFLNKELASFNLRKIDAKPGQDHDGDPVVHVYVYHRLLDTPLDLKTVSVADSKLRDLAWRMGENRFIHIRHLYDEKQKVAS